MTHNWEAIGGRSPLTDITLQQGDALRTQLAADGLDIPVVVGMRNWRPFIADAIRDIERIGARRIVGIPMAPQFSTLSVQKYIDAATSVLPAGIEFSCVRSFHDHPLLIEAFAEKVRAEQPRPDEDIVFTAHSLPERVAAAGDPYPNQVAATAKAIADRCGIRSYHTAYQSAGRTPNRGSDPISRSTFGCAPHPAFAACWSCLWDSSAITRKFCSTSMFKPPPPRAKRASPSAAPNR